MKLFHKKKRTLTIACGLISVPTGRFPRGVRWAAWANRMLVTKALSQDVMFLAFVPLLLIP